MGSVQKYFGVIVIVTFLLSSCSRLKTDCSEREIKLLEVVLWTVRESGPYYDQNLDVLRSELAYCHLTLKDIGSSEDEIRQLKEKQVSVCRTKSHELLQRIFRDEFEIGGYGEELCYLRTILHLCNLTLADVIDEERELHLWTMRWSHKTERRKMEYAAWRNTQCKGRSYQDRQSCLYSMDMLYEPTMCWPF